MSGVGDRIDVTGIEVFARHGVFPHEQRDGQVFSIDLSLGVDLETAGADDDLAATVDYGDLTRRVHDMVASERWDLIERVARRVADVVLEDRRVTEVTVTVHKPHAPIPVPVGDVAVTITRTR